MPGLKDLLIQRATSPMISADSIDKPSLSRSPARARVEGFFGGAIENLSKPTTIAGLGASILPFVRPVQALAKGAKGIPKLMPNVDEIAEAVDPLMDMVNATKSGPVGPKWLGKSVQPANRWEAGVQPKKGGALDDVLKRAAEKQGAGQDVTPGEMSLMQQFMKYPRPRR